MFSRSFLFCFDLLSFVLFCLSWHGSNFLNSLTWLFGWITAVGVVDVVVVVFTTNNNNNNNVVVVFLVYISIGISTAVPPLVYYSPFLWLFFCFVFFSAGGRKREPTKKL
ncbi:hypothetical protein, unlikely [Trypanosoma brucei gambiense DAL972]|uniref:T. brucei spp.-specific protein n=1 Tax=Trypanosoma brucei gambiense (strain MHOM/CI/86/DAL972) TaxID=679716 RepID=D0A0K3_TRYB9|nr:hypothetical protein, unlikely [Trypanosoma brucei gambiense DAL972]CBH16761.1 hypothetical protein, unlikely [Trypanosoma brucei gambiense DAL972]|eukprot:XP_011779025.1 hypothetical protein, unlikely [Trypanosoma brucei gambiense DAL972]